MPELARQVATIFFLLMLTHLYLNRYWHLFLKGWNQGLVRVVARRSFLMTIKTSSFLALSFQSSGHAYLKIFRLAAGSFVFCRKEYFEKIGGFSEKLFAGEEILFSINYKRLCRANGEIFEIIDRFPVVTSSRKLSWFSPLQILSSMFIPLLFPWALKSRLMCWFWYKRPPKKN